MAEPFVNVSVLEGTAKLPLVVKSKSTPWVAVDAPAIFTVTAPVPACPLPLVLAGT